MTDDPSGGTIDSLDRKLPIGRLVAGFLLFSAAYALVNQLPLTQSILYRAAAFDYTNAGLAAVSFAIQAMLLFTAILLLSKRWIVVTLVLVALSACVNMVYGQIVGDTLDLQKTGWLMTEARQAGDAVEEFTAPLAIAIGKLMLAVAMFVSARQMLRGTNRKWIRDEILGKLSKIALMALLAAPSLLWPWLNLHPLGAERNIYSFAAAMFFADPPPERAEVTAIPDPDPAVRKIIWLVDESVSYEAFDQIIAPQLAGRAPLNFGEAASMGHCSTPSNVALRSGVSVRSVNSSTDLRRTASIWGYAAKAGYTTTMIDGQVYGPPQNLLLPPERALIDRYENTADGMKTDLKIARSLNASLKTGRKQFTYAILRGVHFQYRDHYPAGTLPKGSSTQAQYEAAISYSKAGFFDALLDGINRSEVAIFYTSDHGQNIKKGITPHCSGTPVEAEFSVPLIAFLPPKVQQDYKSSSGGRSHSQIFPTTLSLMGYDTAYTSKRYDNILTAPTAQYVWFGRGVVPVKNDGEIDVQIGELFPGQ